MTDHDPPPWPLGKLTEQISYAFYFLSPFPPDVLYVTPLPESWPLKHSFCPKYVYVFSV